MSQPEPTIKQTRAALKKIYYHRYQLQRALDQAHDLGVIRYEDYETQSPCFSLWEAKQRIDATTEKARAQALKLEIISEMKGIYA